MQKRLVIGTALGAMVVGGITTLAMAAPGANKPGTPIRKARTFTKDIAPIVFDKCVSCHRQGQAAPFPLSTYGDVKKRGRLIAQVTESRSMPPWKVGKCDVTFQGDRSLSDDQIKAISDWVEGGMKQGNLTDLPHQPSFSSEWTLGKPDLVIKMPKAFNVPADGRDIYRNFAVPLNLPNDVYIRAIDFEPGSRSVVHHCLFYYDTTHRGIAEDGKDGQPGYDGSMGAVLGRRGDGSSAGSFGSASDGPVGNLGGWAVGAQPEQLPAGLAYTIPKGADLILATHFHPSGKPETELSTIGLYFGKKPPERKFVALLLPPAFGFLSGIDIPAGAKEYSLDDSFTLPLDIKAFAVAAHAHFLGKKFTLVANLPNGETKNLFNIPAWDFNWQGQYRYSNFVSLPKGTKLVSHITYDNSSDNIYNPSNPPRRVKWGEQTTDEMGSVILSVVPEKDSEMELLGKEYMKHLIATANARRTRAK